MRADLLLPYLRKEILESYFEICHYFIVTKNYGKEEDQIRLSYYKSLLLADPLPDLPIKNKLDLENISAEKEVKLQLSRTYTSDFIIHIIHSGIHVFFDKMERYAAIDVQLRSTPELYSFFYSMTPIIVEKVKDVIQQEFGESNAV